MSETLALQGTGEELSRTVQTAAPQLRDTAAAGRRTRSVAVPSFRHPGPVSFSPVASDPYDSGKHSSPLYNATSNCLPCPQSLIAVCRAPLASIEKTLHSYASITSHKQRWANQRECVLTQNQLCIHIWFRWYMQCRLTSFFFIGSLIWPW